MPYIVVLENHLTQGRFWKDYITKDDFDKVYSKSLGDVVAEGISTVDALELCGVNISYIVPSAKNKPDTVTVFPIGDLHNPAVNTTIAKLVIENVDRHSGHAGLRYIKEISTLGIDKDKKQIRKNPHIRLLAEVSDPKQEEILLAYTPEVCLLTSAIEDYYEKNFDGDGYPQNIDFNFFILEAITKILQTRQYWKDNSHINRVLNDFPFVDVDSLEFEDIKRLFRIIESSSTQPNGSVDDLKDTFGQLCFEKAQIDYDHLLERLDDDLTPPPIS